MNEHLSSEELLTNNQQSKAYTDGRLQQASCCGHKLQGYRTYSIKSR
jgi:hypothetical protein